MPSTSMTPLDLEVCKNLVKVLKSGKNSKFNALFLNPFDLKDTPGYLDICGRAMDISTLAQNIDAGVYSNRRQVYEDCNLIFENAIKYHSDKDTTKWIVSPAQNMLKIAKREQQKIENKIAKGLTAGGTLPKLKLKIGGGGGGGAGGDKKNKIKIKQPAGRATGATISRGKTPPPGVVAGSPSGGSPSNSSSRDGKPPPNKKPRLTLKLGLGKSSKDGGKSSKDGGKSSKDGGKSSKDGGKSSKDGGGSASSIKSSSKSSIKSSNKSSNKASRSAAGASTKKSSSSSSTKSSSSSSSSPQKITLKSPVVGNSRGKELPKGVTNPSAGKVLPKGVVAETTKSSSSSSSKASKADTKTAKSTKTSKTGKVTKAVPKPSASSASSSKPLKSISAKSTAPKSATLKSITPKGTTSKSKASTAKQSKAVASATGKSKATKKEKSASSKKLGLKTSSAYKATTGGPAMTPARKAQCCKILNGLKRRKAKNIVWFEKPVSDKKLIQDYKAKIKYPMDMSTMQAKLDNTTFGPGGTTSSGGGGGSKGGYTTVAAFVWDLRRIFGNCLRYNTTNGKDSLRPIAVETLDAADQLCTFFLAKPEYNLNPTSSTPLFPPLLFCWKLCVNVIDTLYNLTNKEDRNPTAYYFMHPVSFFFGGTLPVDYLHKAPKPMDFGTVTSQLMEGQYTSLDQFESDCNLVISNCMAYYGEKAESKVFCDQAARLKQVLQQQLEALNRYVKSSTGLAAQKSAMIGISTATLLPKPPIPLLLNILAELRDQKHTDKATKITEPAMATFEKPVSVAVFPDYMQYVQTPMDLQTVERKIKTVQYATPEDFEYDMHLMFQNCITYNGSYGRKMDHLVTLGKFGLKSFRRIFGTRMKVLDDPSAAASSSSSSSPTGKPSLSRKDPPSGADSQGPTKRIKLGGMTKAAAPRISLSAATLSEAQKAAAARSKASNKAGGAPKTKANQPVPLHIAIAQVKERFPLRRDVKKLQDWEAACARFFKELKRHPWISAARPKFIFHVPVPVLFPELREAYGIKIQKPMDLTTAECTLLAGNRYTTPEDFVNDVALVFANAICFNKDGRDVGDPLSCAYYDASIHLLKYTRWLSLELLSDYLQDIDQSDEPEEDGLPLKSWKLIKGNVKQSRGEMEKIVLGEPIEKSLEGDRYTWMESECEKLLKSLRHQSDLRYMTFFLTPNYPPDYSAFISRPMDWEKVQKTLKKRNYDTFGSVIEDLRLIFTNALKYNSRLAGTDTVSGRAYESAKIMSTKLETAINKLMVTVSDRVERERIDHNNAEREIEAAERVEAARIRAQWKSENADPDKREGSEPQRIEGSLRVRSSSRRNIRESDTDFEVPFFEEELGGQHEESYLEVIKQQKATFERQREELVAMRKSTKAIGLAVFRRGMHSRLAEKWIADEQQRLGISASSASTPTKGTGTSSPGRSPSSGGARPSPSAVSSKLDDASREPVKMKLVSKGGGIKRRKKTRKRKKSPSAGLDWGDDDEE